MKSRLIQVWKDSQDERSAAENMALDEALFLSAVEKNTVRARFYTWSAPAITLGYFHKTDERPQPAGAVRRMTGGGIVEHGADLTFTLAYPKGSEFSQATGSDRYKWIHQALTTSLASANFATELSATPKRASGPCFAAPVEWDLLDLEGTKIAGGAQRRSRGAIIHQGSARIPNELCTPEANWIDDFLSILTESIDYLATEDIDGIEKYAEALKIEKYGNGQWNRR